MPRGILRNYVELLNKKSFFNVRRVEQIVVEGVGSFDAGEAVMLKTRGRFPKKHEWWTEGVTEKEWTEMYKKKYPKT